MGGPYLFGSEGWKLMPGHFAERHGLIVIIALGESIVAIGVGASGELTFGIGVAAVLGVALTAAMWWTYFDIVAIVSGRRLVDAEPGKVQNEMARDSYSYLHLLMIAGTIMVALGLKKTIGHFDDHLHAVPAFALLGGVALYLLGHVLFRYRHIHSINRQRLGLAIVLLILVPVGGRDPGDRGRRDRQRPALDDDRLRDAPLRRGPPAGRATPRLRRARLGLGRRGRALELLHHPGDREAEGAASACPSWRRRPPAHRRSRAGRRRRSRRPGRAPSRAG